MTPSANNGQYGLKKQNTTNPQGSRRPNFFRIWAIRKFFGAHDSNAVCDSFLCRYPSLFRVAYAWLLWLSDVFRHRGRSYLLLTTSQFSQMIGRMTHTSSRERALNGFFTVRVLLFITMTLIISLTSAMQKSSISKIISPRRGFSMRDSRTLADQDPTSPRVWLESLSINDWWIRGFLFPVNLQRDNMHQVRPCFLVLSAPNVDLG